MYERSLWEWDGRERKIRELVKVKSDVYYRVGLMVIDKSTKKQSWL